MKKIIFTFLGVLLLTTSCAEKKTSNSNEVENETSIPSPESKTPSVKGEDVTYATDGTSMTGYIAYDQNIQGKRPGIIVVHEWWGHNDYVRERADMLAKLGYTAIAIDMYGDGKVAGHPDDAMKFSQKVMSNMDEATARFTQAMNVLNNHPTVDASETAAIGYCFGGSIVLTMANKGLPLDAVAAFHSGVDLPVMPNKNLKAEVLIAQGADDPFVSPESEARYVRMVDSVGGKLSYVSYANAVHAFTSKGADSLGKKFNLPLAYNQKADTESWEELEALLARTLNK